MVIFTSAAKWLSADRSDRPPNRGPLVLLLLWLLLKKTRLGILIRAATQDRAMVGALGVNQKWLFTGIFALGSALAGTLLLAGIALVAQRDPLWLAKEVASLDVISEGHWEHLPG